MRFAALLEVNKCKKTLCTLSGAKLSSAMSIDVALSTGRGVGRDTYSLPKKNAATPQVARQWTCHHYIKDTYSLPQKRGCAPVRVCQNANFDAHAKVRQNG